MNVRADEPTQTGLCAELPLEEGLQLFLPTSDGGLLRRSSRWPKPDSHEDARRYCPRCPVMAWCLDEALEVDGHTFRALSPEERAAFGGRREKAARKRPPYLSIGEVAGRILDSGYDVEAVVAVLADWDQRIVEDPDWARRLGLTMTQAGWSKPYREGAQTAEEVLDELVEGTDAGRRVRTE